MALLFPGRKKGQGKQMEDGEQKGNGFSAGRGKFKVSAGGEPHSPLFELHLAACEFGTIKLPLPKAPRA